MTIAFIQPEKFLRTKTHTNPFFDPIIGVLEDFNSHVGVEQVDWCVWLPKAEMSLSGYPQTYVRSYSSFVAWRIVFWRGVHLLLPWIRVDRVCRWYGRLARRFCSFWNHADIIITVAGIFADELQGMFPHKRIVDVQHGVIYSRHEGYFEKDGRLLKQYRDMPNREFWLYGQRYVDCFLRRSNLALDLDARLKVIGDVLNAGSSVFVCPGSFANRNALVCMLQFNDSYPIDALLKMKELWEHWLDENRYIIESHGLKVLLRHHPRFDNVIDFSDWCQKYPWAHVDSRSWDEVYDEATCCVGFNSTTILEAAGRGIPVVILDGKPIGTRSYFAETFIKDEFAYPFSELSLGDWLELDNVEKVHLSRMLMDWHQMFYMPFNPENCRKLLKIDLKGDVK